jgi:multiple sugar transport system permease protein
MVLNKSSHGILYILPAGILLFLVEVIPIAYAIWMSFHKKLAFSPQMTWVGIGNFLSISQSQDVWNSMGRGCLFAVSSTLLQLFIGLGLALTLHESFRGRGLFRSLILITYFVPSIAVGLVWTWMLDSFYGIVNHVLISIGLLAVPINFLGDVNWAMPMVIFINAWYFSPFVVMVLLARMQTIPTSFYEVALIDGASVWRRFWDITLPHLRGAILLAVLLRGIWMFNKFDSIWLLTNGGPIGKTTTLPIYAYFLTFREYNYGRGAAVSVLMFLILSIFAYIYFVFFKPEKEIEVE